MYSIRIKITAITITAILICILSVSAFYLYTYKTENDRTSAEVMNLTSQNTKKSLGKYFESIEQSVEMTANIARETLDVVPLVENGAAGTYAKKNERSPEQNAALDSYLAEYCVLVQKVLYSVANHTNGIASYYFCISPEVSSSEHGFFYSKVGRAGFYERDPLNAATLDPELEYNTWYFTTILRGRPSWIGPYTDPLTDGREIFSYTIPIYKCGTIIGVLGMDILFDTIIDLISPIRVYETGFVWLTDEEGNIIYHPELTADSSADLEQMSIPEEVLQQNSTDNEVIHYNYNGQDCQMAYSSLSNGMRVIITAPSDEIYAARTRLIRIILIITVAITFFFVTVLLIVLQLITKPLQHLTSASKRLAAGDYDVDLNYNRHDEIGALTRSFKHMRDQIRLYIDDLNHRIRTDSLTGLPSMRYFFKLAKEEKLHMQERGESPVLLFFNLIGMKHYNRIYSFEEGDQLICEFSRILADNYGESNVSRINQDHFTALSTEEHVTESLDSILHEAQNMNKGRTLPVRAGIYPARLGDVSISIACDRAKYACDRQRGSYVSGYCWFDDDMLAKIENVPYIINHLDQALRERWIKVYYQPIIRAGTDRICDEEALSRWIDPVKGLISPGEFVPILEEAKLVYKLDLYVLEQILEKMKLQTQQGIPVVPHSLNLSRADFDSCDIVEEVRARVDAAGIPRANLTIEVTESIIGSDFDFMKHQIERFQALGFSIWMDDFGSGYSSLDVLQDIRFDLIKFDMHFMQRFYDGQRSKIIFSSLIKMAIELRIDTIAEGVETKEEAEFLKEAGCTKLQGYYYSKAVPMEETLERCRENSRLRYEDGK